ncbi:tetratricopeptide repeat protein 7A-like isoform 2 [Corchorus olitorius]|uniref:Tetratricopeptide repeat protein 7A-like isoform 2 n=1 Tax=Corchorus olitorius TaxID=93759 RepID=A0A1R3L1P8_9ROSI|nr:tetratricopeptide repeat protein 7A-like isoform 2 [Corchorus olitorius]
MRQAITPVICLSDDCASPMVVITMMPTSPRNMPAHFLNVNFSAKHENPMSAPIKGVVAFIIAEYPAGNHLAARQYMRKGNPEFITPSMTEGLNLSLKSKEDLNINKIIARPVKPKNTRKKAVLMAPNCGTAMRIKRKLAPQIAASSNNRK